MTPEDEPAEEGKVLSPQELDLGDKDGVAEIDDGRFVVSPDGKDPDLPPGLADRTSTDDASTGPDGADAGSGPLDRASVRDWHEHRLGESPCHYGFHLSLKSGRSIDHHTIESDDVSMAFNNLLLWYARTVDADLPPGAVLGILLSDVSVPVQYPARAFEEFLMSHGLSTDDSIADLLSVVREEGPVVFPPRTE